MRWHVDMWFQNEPPEVFYENDIIKNFGKFTRKHLYWSCLCNKVARITPKNLLKKRVQHRGFTVNSVKYLKTAFLDNLRASVSVVLPRILLKVFYFSQEIRWNDVFGSVS